MTKSGLELNKYFFPTVSILANPHHKPNDGAEASIDIEAHVAPIQEGKNRYQLSLKIELLSDDEDKSSYTGMLQVVGQFSIEKDMTNEEAGYFLHKNGSEILFSMAREYLMTITSRGPWAPVMLPTFQSPTDEEIELIVNN